MWAAILLRKEESYLLFLMYFDIEHLNQNHSTPSQAPLFTPTLLYLIMRTHKNLKPGKGLAQVAIKFGTRYYSLQQRFW